VEPVAQNDPVLDEEEAQDNGDLEDNLNTYLLPADAEDEEDQEADVSCFEANDKENADSNELNTLSNTNHVNTDAVKNMNVNDTGGTRQSCTATEQEENVENGEGIDGGKSDWKQCAKTDSKQSPTETIEERLERFRLKKEEAKKKMAAKEASTGSPKPITKKAADLVNPPPGSNSDRQSNRPPFQV